MRFAILTFSILSVIVSMTSTLVQAAPLPPSRMPSSGIEDTKDILLKRASQLIDTPTLEGLGLAKANSQPTQPEKGSADGQSSGRSKRASDSDTAGGNAYTGDTGNVSSGHIINKTGQDNTITNMGGNTIPIAGNSISGDAAGGEGDGIGPGGNAYTGNTGNADGGYVDNEAGTVNNMGMGNNGGQGGMSISGTATGGGS